MKKFAIIFSSLIFSYNLSASENNSEKTYELSVNNSLSGAIIAVANKLESNISHLSKEERNEYTKFKEVLNRRLETDSIKQKIHFKTADYDLSGDVVSYINNLVLSLNNYENLNYELKSFSDVRGDEVFNKNLSLKRANTIKSLLLSSGIPDDNINIINYGEDLSTEHSNYEDYFFDRRVELSIRK